MIWIILIPFIGTVLGALMVFFIKENTNEEINLKNVLYGLSSGVMLASAIFSLLIPSINYFNSSKFMKIFPTIMGLFCGFIIMILIDKIAQNLLIKRKNDKLNFEKDISGLKKNLLLFIALTIHNIPEGMAVGIGMVENSLNSGLILSLGIAIQNIPEGLIAALPFKECKGLSKFSFLFGILSGIVEPIFTVITLNIARRFLNIMPYMLSFACGCMIYVVIKELIPSFTKKDEKSLGIISFVIGFIIMMILDVCLA